MRVFFCRSHIYAFDRKAVATASVGMVAAMLSVGVSAQSIPAWEAEAQARIQAAQAAADAAVARANAQVAEAQARIQQAQRTINTSRARDKGVEMKVLQSSGSGVNSIHVVGNHAGKVVVDCRGDQPTEVNVNSVVADGKNLQGKTVVVTGRNTRDVELRGNCKPGNTTQDGARSSGPSSNVNSVIIR